MAGRVIDVKKQTTIAIPTKTGGFYDQSRVGNNQAFDAVSNRTELRATIGNTPDFKNTYTYDKLKRLTDVVQTGQAGGNAVVAKHIMQAFNAANQRSNITRYQSSGTANLVASTNFTFDTVGRLDGIQHLRQGAINLNSYSYTYDGMSRLSNVTSTAEGTATFSYDSSSQLKSAIGTQPAESYAYDDNGNRNTTGYVTGTDNRTTSDPNFNYQYDAEGNLIRKTSKTNSQDDTLYQYDHRNRLTRVQFGQFASLNNYVNYEYDPFNRLVRRATVPAPSYVLETTYWIYDEGINPVLELTNNFSGNGYVTHRYLWSNSVDDLLADEQVNPSNNTANTLYPLSDHLGSIRDIADFDEATGITAIANHRRYNSFGKLMQETGTADIAFGYTGKLYDKKTGLQNNWNRWYDSNLGKWISQDPIGFAAGDANLYRYVKNGPTNKADPSGLQETADPETNGRPWYDKRPFSFDMDAHTFQRWHLRLEAGEYWTYRRGCVGLAGIRISNDDSKFPHQYPGVRAFGSYQEAMASLAAIEANGSRGMLVAYQDTNPIITSFPPLGNYPSSSEFDPNSLPLGDYNFASLVELYGTAYWEWIDSGWEAKNSMFYPDPKDDPYQSVGRDVHHCRTLPSGYHEKTVNTVYLVVPSARDIDKGRDGQGKQPRYRRGSPVYSFPPSIAPPSTNRPTTKGVD